MSLTHKLVLAWGCQLWGYCSLAFSYSVLSHTHPSSHLIEWISKTGLQRGCDPNALQHCIMGAFGPLGALQREHVHCVVGGIADLRSQTHELSRSLVNSHTLLCFSELTGVLAGPDCALLCLASCLNSAFAHGESFRCDGPTLGRCIATSTPERWEVSRAFAGSARTTHTSSACLSRYTVHACGDFFIWTAAEPVRGKENVNGTRGPILLRLDELYK